jgi:uncharacterized membrane protein YraQ (UPF0718 family)
MDAEKTQQGLKLGLKKLRKNLPVFLNMIILVAMALYFISDQVIIKYLGSGEPIVSIGIAVLFGSISFMPGFVAFPLAGILLEKGVSYMVLAAFTTTLMMVGILTYPVEKEFFGHQVTIIRNLVGLAIAIVVSLAIGLVYGEVSLWI